MCDYWFPLETKGCVYSHHIGVIWNAITTQGGFCSLFSVKYSQIGRHSQSYRVNPANKSKREQVVVRFFSQHNL